MELLTLIRLQAKYQARIRAAGGVMELLTLIRLEATYQAGRQ